MHEYGKVTELGCYHTALGEISMHDEFHQANHIKNYSHMKHRFIDMLGLIHNEQISMLTSEDAEERSRLFNIIDNVYSIFNKPEELTVCPLSGLCCTYVQMVGCKYATQIVSDASNGIYALLWNKEDTEAMSKWYSSFFKEY